VEKAAFEGVCRVDEVRDVFMVVVVGEVRRGEAGSASVGVT
jgi:hypothetical protein